MRHSQLKLYVEGARSDYNLKILVILTTCSINSVDRLVKITKAVIINYSKYPVLPGLGNCV